MDKDTQEDKLVAIIGFLSAALIIMTAIFAAAWFTDSHSGSLIPAQTALCRPS